MAYLFALYPINLSRVSVMLFLHFLFTHIYLRVRLYATDSQYMSYFRWSINVWESNFVRFFLRAGQALYVNEGIWEILGIKYRHKIFTVLLQLACHFNVHSQRFIFFFFIIKVSLVYKSSLRHWKEVALIIC